MSYVVGLPNNSFKPITNTAWVCARLCKLQKGCTPLASDKAYKLLVHGRWFSPGTPSSSTAKTGCHDIAEILKKVALKHTQKINQNQSKKYVSLISTWIVNYIYMYIFVEILHQFQHYNVCPLEINECPLFSHGHFTFVLAWTGCRV